MLGLEFPMKSSLFAILNQADDNWGRMHLHPRKYVTTITFNKDIRVD